MGKNAEMEVISWTVIRKSKELQHDVSPYIAEPEVDGYPLKGSLSAREIISILKHIGDRRTVTSMPDGRKENVYYIVSENNNELRRYHWKT